MKFEFKFSKNNPSESESTNSEYEGAKVIAKSLFKNGVEDEESLEEVQGVAGELIGLLSERDEVTAEGKKLETAVRALDDGTGRDLRGELDAKQELFTRESFKIPENLHPDIVMIALRDYTNGLVERFGSGVITATGAIAISGGEDAAAQCMIVGVGDPVRILELQAKYMDGVVDKLIKNKDSGNLLVATMALAKIIERLGKLCDKATDSLPKSYKTILGAFRDTDVKDLIKLKKNRK